MHTTPRSGRVHFKMSCTQRKKNALTQKLIRTTQLSLLKTNEITKNQFPSWNAAELGWVRPLDLELQGSEIQTALGQKR